MSGSIDGGGVGGSGGRDPFVVLRRVRTIIDQMGWQGLGQSIIGTIAVTFAFGGLDIVNALVSIPVNIFATLASVIPALNEATFGGIAGFMAAAFEAGATSFNSGWIALLGIFQTPLGVGVALFVVWEVLYFLDLVDSDVIGLVIDAPDMILSSDEGDVAGEED